MDRPPARASPGETAAGIMLYGPPHLPYDERPHRSVAPQEITLMTPATRRLLAAVLALIAALAGSALFAVDVKEGEKAPDFDLPAIDGGAQLKLSDFRGKV